MTDNNNCDIPKGIFGILKKHSKETAFFIHAVAVAISVSIVVAAVGYTIGEIIK